MDDDGTWYIVCLAIGFLLGFFLMFAIYDARFEKRMIVNGCAEYNTTTSRFEEINMLDKLKQMEK